MLASSNLICAGFASTPIQALAVDPSYAMLVQLLLAMGHLGK